jgi:hypothetical protein
VTACGRHEIAISGARGRQNDETAGAEGQLSGRVMLPYRAARPPSSATPTITSSTGSAPWSEASPLRHARLETADFRASCDGRAIWSSDEHRAAVRRAGAAARSPHGPTLLCGLSTLGRSQDPRTVGRSSKAQTRLRGLPKTAPFARGLRRMNATASRYVARGPGRLTSTQAAQPALATHRLPSPEAA